MKLIMSDGRECEQGSPEDKATWWRCAQCGFTGPAVGSNLDGEPRCMGIMCNGVTPNPNVPHIPEPKPIPMRLVCESCGELHIDEEEWATRLHHTHTCECCGHTWRPAKENTVGVRFIPGFKNEVKAIDWGHVLPHQLKVYCSDCEQNRTEQSEEEVHSTNAPGQFDWTFYKGKWRCERHTLKELNISENP